MATLQVYELTRPIKTTEKKTAKVEQTNNLPDDTNLVIVDGILMLMDGFNETGFSVNDIIECLDKIADKFGLSQAESNMLTAVHNFFDQLSDEYK